MEVKELDQFLVDYFEKGAIVSVDARWLQQQLRELEEQRRKNVVVKSYKQKITELREEIMFLRATRPKYHLDITA